MRGWPLFPLRRFRQSSLNALVRALPYRDLLPLALAIGALFAVLGPATDVMGGARQSAVVVTMTAVFAGAIAIGYAISSMKRRYDVVAVLGAINVGWVLLAKGGHLGTFPPLAPHLVA